MGLVGAIAMDLPYQPPFARLPKEASLGQAFDSISAKNLSIDLGGGLQIADNEVVFPD